MPRMPLSASTGSFFAVACKLVFDPAHGQTLNALGAGEEARQRDEAHAGATRQLGQPDARRLRARPADQVGSRLAPLAQPFETQLDLSEIVVHEANEPNWSLT